MIWSMAGADQTTDGAARFLFPEPQAKITSRVTTDCPDCAVLPMRELALALWLQLPDELLDTALTELIDIYRFQSEDLLSPETEPLTPVTYAEGRIVESVERPPLAFDPDLNRGSA